MSIAIHELPRFKHQIHVRFFLNFTR